VKDRLVGGIEFGGETNVVSVGIGISQVVRKVAAGNFDADTMTA
jgi:hypothetical protein